MPETVCCPWWRYESKSGCYVCHGGREGRMPTVTGEMEYRRDYCCSVTGYTKCSLAQKLDEMARRQPSLMEKNTRTRDWESEVPIGHRRKKRKKRKKIQPEQIAMIGFANEEGEKNV